MSSMTAAMAVDESPSKFVFARYYAYIGIIVSLIVFVNVGMDYQNHVVFPALTSSTGLMWALMGAVCGAAGAFALATFRPSNFESKTASILISWFDIAMAMIALTFVFAAFEPSVAHVNYEDQSNLLSANIIMTMNMLFIFSAVCYVVHIFAYDSFIGKLATYSAWAAIYAGGSGLLLRWHESYLIADSMADISIGHAPVSNLYEVFVFFCCITTMIYLALEKKYQVKSLGAILLPLVSAGVFFGIWLDSIGQSDIKPLVPALQSYWMKIHVPMNFVGYGSFAVASAAGVLYLIREMIENKSQNSHYLTIMPTLKQLDELGYKAVAIGFPAFTLATILGAAWAAEAWGGYWSWDPKETWALIVWLVFGAYLHVRVTHGWSGRALAWWTVVGFGVTVFCFVGVNMYLSGLHSYGRLA